MSSFFEHRIAFYCPECDREAQLVYQSFFDKLLGRKLKFCPFCGYEFKEETNG